MGDAAEGNLPLLHGLEQSALHLGRGPVDLVGEEELGEHRTLAGLERPLLGQEDHGPGEVRRKEIRRELDPGEACADTGGERSCGEGLRQPGNTLDQHVSVTEEGRQKSHPEIVLTYDDLRELRLQRFDDRGQIGYPAFDLL